MSGPRQGSRCTRCDGPRTESPDPKLCATCVRVLDEIVTPIMLTTLLIALCLATVVAVFTSWVPATVVLLATFAGGFVYVKIIGGRRARALGDTYRGWWFA